MKWTFVFIDYHMSIKIFLYSKYVNSKCDQNINILMQLFDLGLSPIHWFCCFVIILWEYYKDKKVFTMSWQAQFDGKYLLYIGYVF